MRADEIYRVTRPDTEERDTKAQLKKQYPGADFAVVRATSEDQLHAELEELMRSRGQSPINALYVISHGSSSWKKEGQQNPKSIDSYISEIGTQQRGFVSLTRPGSVESSFGPIVGKFADGAKIIFYGCATIAPGNETEKLEVMRKIAGNFDLRKGSVYMNSNLGMTAVSDLTTPFTQRGGAFFQLVGFLENIMTPVMLVPATLMDQAVFNQGYSLFLEDGKAKLYKTALWEATERPRPAFLTAQRKEVPAPPVLEAPAINTSREKSAGSIQDIQDFLKTLNQQDASQASDAH